MTHNKLLIFIPLLILAACSPAPQPTSEPTPEATATQPAAVLPSSTPETTTVTPTNSPVPEPTSTTLALATPTVQPIQIFFPTVIPQEGAEYRPPLYPIPWSLSPYDHFYFARPIGATYPAVTDIGYLYGGLYFGPDAAHSGIDIPAPRGAEVLAAAPGTVVWAGYGLYSGSQYNTQDPYGLAVAIRHDFGYQNQPLYTIYAHMDEIDVMVGQWMDTGETLGNVGTTGLTTGPHLHFEVRLGKNDF
jgi:murein DD-endopeptidase MepM/ murein hydrolase activator NlpD